MPYSQKWNKGLGVVPATYFVAVSKYLAKETGGEVCFGSQFDSTEYHGGKAQTGARGNILSVARKQRERESNAGAQLTFSVLFSP